MAVLQFRQVQQTDLEQIIPLEQAGFTPEEAATEQALRERAFLITDSFIVAVDDTTNTIAGYINGPVIDQKYITDDLFDSIKPNSETGGYLSILGIVVAQKYQHQGLAGMLLQHFEQLARSTQRQGVTLTCKKELVTLYEQYGYTNAGSSASTHGNVAWFNMIKLF
ncbi:GNAT family N-acetyltransferase [Staphylococcus arlettae]|uniref:GNAT family N-acetyltransferase n=1 Tax=Staphylococcus arlettae TaxID=29378 RepID=UPI001071C52C|nr:GNAT family N-acetyltransferase [Staphylococcus arlettae]MBF0737072.1 GNAT family N-acetyltransferase [Staphylococcus arlettae]TFU48222.1 GNAT family N-acetyltransferase [Staphylococcus arlettae]